MCVTIEEPMLVREALVASPFVVTPDTTLFHFIDGILAGNQTTASVVDGRLLVGMVSSTDVLKRLMPPYLQFDEKLANVLHATFFEEELGQLRNVRVRDVMTWPADTLPPDAPVMQAVSLFVQRSLKTVPVVEDRDFLGAVTRRSVLTLIRGAAAR